MCVLAAKHYTAEQYSKTGRKIPRKHHIRSDLSWNTRQDFLKIPTQHTRDSGPKPTEYRFLNVVTTYGLIQPVGYCSNHVLPDIRFLNMKFGWTKYHGNVIAHHPFKAVCVNSNNHIKFPLLFIAIKYNVIPITILI